MKRQLIQIPAEQVNKLREIDAVRPDLKDYPISKKVHILLQEKLAELLKSQADSKEKASAGKWIEYIREAIPLHTVSTIAVGVVRDSEEMIGKAFTRILVSNDIERTWWGNWEDDVWNIGEFLIRWLKDKKNRDSHFSKHKQRFLEITRQADSIRGSSLKSLKDEELLSEYSRFHRDTMKHHALSFDIDAIDIVLEDKIKNKLRELMKAKGEFTGKEFNNALGIVLTPHYTSYMTELDIGIYRIISYIKQKKIDAFEENAEVASRISELLKRFWWVELSWSQRIIKTKEKIVEELKRIIEKGEDSEKEIKRLSHEVDEARKRKEKLREELGFDEEMEFYLQLFENYAVFHDYRKEAQMKTAETLNVMLDDIGRRKGLKFEDIVWCWPDEIKELLRGKDIDISSIKERKKSFFMIVEKKDIESCTGRDAVKRRGEELSTAYEGITNFKGTTASPGKVIGKVKVCFSSDDAIKKVEKGDILVASMTLPDYVPAMKKAAAIVTDEGGVTCHAAIVSREMKIPCVIGTGIATKVLKDGDTIEVNANHGIVSVIK